MIRCLLTAVLLAGIAGSAQATVLTFDLPGFLDWADIPNSYGDRVHPDAQDGFGYGQGNDWTPNVRVGYRTLSGSGRGTTLYRHLDLWTREYGDLTNVAYAVNDQSTAELFLVPDAGYGVRLNSFDLALWLPAEIDLQPVPVRFYDGQFRLLNEMWINLEGDHPNHVTINPDLTWKGILRIQFGEDWNVGIDNINFDQVALYSPGVLSMSAVPEPGTAALGGLGAFGLVGLAWRCRRQGS